MVTLHNSPVWPVPYACAQPYHPGSGSMRKFPPPIPLQKNNGPALNLDCLLRRQLGKWREIFVAHHKAPKYKSQFPLGPVHTYLFLFENAHFFLPTVRTHPVKTITENLSFQKRSPERRFLKTPDSHLRVDGRKRRFSENDDAIHHLLLVLRMLCEGCYRISIVLVFWCGRAKDSNTLRVDAYFLKKGIRVDRASHEKCSNFPN